MTNRGLIAAELHLQPEAEPIPGPVFDRGDLSATAFDPRGAACNSRRAVRPPETSPGTKVRTMQKSSIRTQALIGAALVLLLVATRGRHFATLHSLPGATWAVFFLAGIHLRPRWALPALLALVWSWHFVPFLLGGAGLQEVFEGGRAFCLTPAYLSLVPAHASLWVAGRWYAQRHPFAWRSLLPLGAAALAGATVCELFSSGGFYWFSGRFAEPNLVEFAGRLVTYFPQSLQAMAIHVAAAAAIHGLILLVRGAVDANEVKAAR